MSAPPNSAFRNATIAEESNKTLSSGGQIAAECGDRSGWRAAAIKEAFAETACRPPDDPDAHLASNLLLAIWTTAFLQAHDVYRRQGNAAGAKTRFLAVIGQGTMGVTAAMVGTPYA